MIGDFDGEIDATSREIDQRAKADPYVEVLCQIRGIGRYIAMLVIAEVGDIGRFPSARHLCAWAGLTPTVRSSDGRARLGHITGQGSPALRWALVEAAQHSARGGGPLRQAYERISKRRGKSVAKVAVARKYPDALLLRPARRRDPLPDATGQGAHDQNSGGRTMTRREIAIAPDPVTTSGSSSELVCCQWPPPARPDGRRPRT